MGSKLQQSSDTQAQDNILHREFPSSELTEVSCIETIVAGKEEITLMPSSSLFQIQLTLLQEGGTAHPGAMPATQAGPEMQFSQLGAELESCTSYQSCTNSSQSMRKM